jgi:hypothetical protein
MNVSTITSDFFGIVRPVLGGMHAGPLQNALLSGFAAEADSLSAIEQCFMRLTSRRHDPEVLKHFFQSWSQTNNSAASVSGLASRITLAARAVRDEQAKLGYYRVVDDLQRITDEDLGANGGVLHSDLYYRMATRLCGDDSWLSKRYCIDAAHDFRNSLLQQRLRDRDILNGLLHTLIHEVYTHGEVELIHEMCQAWLPIHMGIPTLEARKILAWVTVHTGGTESNHFRHATDAVAHYCAASGSRIDGEAAEALFRSYLQRKARVMEELIPVLQ